jgi:hypothetical protein
MVICVPWEDILMFGIRLLAASFSTFSIVNFQDFLVVSECSLAVPKIFFLVSIILIMHVVINKEDCRIGALKAAT